MNNPNPNFPTRVPVGALLGFLASLMLLFGAIQGWRMTQNPAERFYVGGYVKSAAWMYWDRLPFSHFIPGSARGEAKRDFTLMVGQTAIHYKVRPSRFHAYLVAHVYDGDSPFATLPFWLIGWFIVAVTAVIVGGVCDARRHRRAREGVPLRGPETLTPNQFNKITKGDGFALRIKA